MYISLQILRGAAAWSVVFLHIIQSYFMGEYSGLFWTAVKTFGDTGVDIFFVLSGFVMALTAKKYQGRGMLYWLLRCIRILPVYWFYTLLLLLSFILLPMGTYMADWNWLSLFHSVLLLFPGTNPYNGEAYPFLYVGWTLAYEMFFYLVLSIILALKLKNPILACAVFLSIFSMALMQYEFLGKGTLILLEFVAGMLICELHHKYKFLTHPIIMVFGWMVAVALYLGFGYSLQTKMALACMLVVSGLFIEPVCQKLEKYLHVPKILGDVSYSTYLCHIIVIGWFYATFNPANFSEIQTLLAVLSICMTVFVLSWLSYKIIETGTLPDLMKKKAKKFA